MTVTDTAIQVEGLSKRYRIGAAVRRPDNLRDALAHKVTAPFRNFRRLRDAGRAAPAEETVWALRDVSFDAKHGEVLGIVGRNGAGKSTLLRILSRITEPTAGRASVYGRVGALLEVGTGFHPELTGRENVYLNGSILGMDRARIAARFEEIVEFSGIARFIDTPVKRYSSGMYLRLAFAVAAHLEPEILIVDEVLAVGDAGFQQKCLGKMGEVSARQGRTVLFVSHHMPSVQALCKRALLLDDGQIVADGTPRDVIARYLSTWTATSATPLMNRADREGDGTVRLESVCISAPDGTATITSSTPLRIALRYRASAPLIRPNVQIDLYTEMDVGVYRLDTDVGGLPTELPAEGTLLCVTAPINLMAGVYWLNISLATAGTVRDSVRHAARLTVEAEDFHGTGKAVAGPWIGLLQQKWSLVAG